MTSKLLPKPPKFGRFRARYEADEATCKKNAKIIRENIKKVSAKIHRDIPGEGHQLLDPSQVREFALKWADFLDNCGGYTAD